jgi:cysteine desulfurase
MASSSESDELSRSSRAVYLDCNATCPIEPEVLESMVHYCREEYGNAGSRTHVYGAAANRALRRAREQVAAVVASSWEDVVFTSGATESNNLAIFGVAAATAANSSARHIISTQIEHKAVLEPLEELTRRGFEVTLIPVEPNGVMDVRAFQAALRSDTLLVSVMQVNNETGVIQPLAEVGKILSDHPAVFHTDAAQGFGKELDGLRCERLDLISISGHKIYAPKGIGALVLRSSRRELRLTPLLFGGGQESGLRPGTVPVHLAVALGVAASAALRDFSQRQALCLNFRDTLFERLASLRPVVHGDPSRTLPHVVNIRFGEIDSEAVMIALRELVAISNGSACTSARYEPSHVLRAMGLTDQQANAATRWSWCHRTSQPNWNEVENLIRLLI